MSTATKPRRAPRKSERTEIAKRADERSLTPGPAEPVTWTLESIYAAEFCKQARAVALAASTDDARRVLMAVRIAADGKTLLIEATDSYRLYRFTKSSDLPKVAALVPAAFLARNLPKRIGALDMLRLTFSDHRFSIEFDEETYTSPLIGGPYPNTDALLDGIPVEGEGHEGVKAYNPKVLADVFKAAGVLGDNATAVRVMSGLDPFKPTRFEVHAQGGVLTMVLMPVRTT